MASVQGSSKGIEPIFMRNKDIKMRDLKPITVCKAMGRIIGNSNVDGAQLIPQKQIWMLYVKDKDECWEIMKNFEE